MDKDELFEINVLAELFKKAQEVETANRRAGIMLGKNSYNRGYVTGTADAFAEFKEMLDKIIKDRLKGVEDEK